MGKKQKKMLARILVSAVLFAAGFFLPLAGWSQLVFYLTVYAIIGWDIVWKAVRNIAHGQVFDENFLMALATIGAFCLQEFPEAVEVMLFYQVGELFQSYAVGKSRRNISELMDIRPDHANVERDGRLEQVDPDEVEIGTHIIVRPGEKVPIDGVVVEGTSTLDTAALTGESVPRDVCAGEEVVSGCINMSGVLTIRTTREFGESTVSKILDLVENASSRKSRSEAFITRFARVYTPAVCISALALALLPPLVLMLSGAQPQWGSWIYRALTFLVISCPCALVISIPLSFFAGIGGASNAGILIKGSNYLETLSQAKTVVFDKTGTLTKGVFAVNAIHHSIIDEHQLIEYAALAESASSHPISQSLQKAYGQEIDRTRVREVKEISGKGITALVDGIRVAAGNGKLMDELGISYQECHSVGTIVHMALDGRYAGHIVISDLIKPTSAQAVQALRRCGVNRIVMLSGDKEETAQAIGRELGIDEVYGGLMPDDKVTKVEELIASRRGDKEKLVFVGDGINDAPVLSRADIGIAMGAMGADAAIEAADVVLMDDDPLKIAKAIRIARKCLCIVRENIVFAIGIKLICLLLGAMGIANMWLAIFADVGVMIIAVLNAIRALFVRKL